MTKNKKQIRQRLRARQPPIREVWSSNYYSEILLLNDVLQCYKILSIDTEFPGCIRSTPRGAIEEQVYEDLRFNVSRTKLIQLGVTASNELGEVGCSWEFNFSDFDSELDAHNPSSISFLRQNGIDFEKLKKDGVPLRAFTVDFVPVLRRNYICQWVTFHGLYDVGYLLKAMGFGQLPESIEEFAGMVANEIGTVRDLKYMIRFCDRLEDRVGLERLSELVGEKRFGMKHHAGSDSLLTACVHTKMTKIYGLESSNCDGYLYGISNRLHCQYQQFIIPYGTIMFGQFPSSLPIAIST